MISSVPLSVALTVLFALSGGYSLLRWASLRAGVAGHHGDQVAELSHVLMSLGMIAMVWAYGGGTGDAVQLIAYLALSGYFLTRLLRGRATGHPGCPAPGFHLLMSGSMVWMVAAMPLLMAGSVAGPSGGMQMDGMTMGGADTGLDARPVTATPGWAIALTWVFIAGLVLGAGFWLRRALPAPSGTSAAATSATATSAAPTVAAPTVAATSTAVASTAVTSTTVTSTTVASTTVASYTAPANPLLAALTPRADAVCHLAMSLGMAAMFLAML
ncbi:MAG: hypothetical protein QOG96_5059 [Pseudonocardiales bacterium]|nr:hypothetical protein [Pseudonocardiales bacterium]